MKPVALPMLHLLRLSQDGHGLGWDIGLGWLIAANSQHALELTRKHFDKARYGRLPVVENPLRSTTVGQFHVAGDYVPDNLRVLSVEQGLEIDGVDVATFLGEIPALIKNIGETAAHTSRKISATRAEYQHPPIRHVFTAVISHAFNDRGRPGIAYCKTLPCDAIKECLPARGAIEGHVANQNIFLGREAGSPRRIHNDAAARQTFSDVIIGLAFERQGHPFCQKCTQALPS